VRIPIGIDTLYTGECNGSITLRNNRAIFNKLLVRLGASDMLLSGTLSNYEPSFTGGRSSMPLLRLKIASRTFSTVGLLPHMNLNVGRPLLAWLPSADITLDFTAARFLMPSDTLTRVAARLQLLDYFVKLRQLDYTSTEGHFVVNGWTDYSQEDRTTFSIATRIATSDFGTLMKRYLGRDEIAGGKGEAALTLNGVYDDSGKVDLVSLGGRGRVRITDVVLRRYSVLSKLFKYLGAEGRDSVRFANAAFTVDITDGRVYFNRLAARGTSMDVKLDGWHGFDGTLDYKLALKIFPPLSGLIAAHLVKTYPDLEVGHDNSLSLGIVAGGTTNDARFTIVSFNGALAERTPNPPNTALAIK